MEYIGRKELIQLPELGRTRLEAKVDTGAYRSAVHCKECFETERNGKRVLKAVFEWNNKPEVTMYFEDFNEKLIKSSFGDSELRYCVKMVLRIGKKRIRSEVSLTDRSDMKYPVLIGRKTLRKKFLVDVSRAHLTWHGK